MTRTEERVYAQRYVNTARAVNQFCETLGIIVGGIGVAWVLLNAMFPNSPLQ